MALAGKQVYSFRDFTGQVETTSMNVVSTATATTLSGDLAALSNAHLCTNRGPYTTGDDGSAGANASYPNVEDKLVVVFKGAGGSTHKFSIPAPKTALFLPDGESLDPTNATWTTARDQILLTACDGSGTLLTSFSRGFRRRRLSKRG